MLKILFLIHDLGRGGAEKVLVNLVNNMDHEQFDITVMTLFGGGVNERFIGDRVRYKKGLPVTFRGNSHAMKLLSPYALHRLLIREHYDVEIAYLEGPSARIISGSRDPKTKRLAWIHGQYETKKGAARSFRSRGEALACYSRFHRILCVSRTVKSNFLSVVPVTVPVEVMYNTNESEKILTLSKEAVDDVFRDGEIRLVSVGRLIPVTGYDRLLKILRRLRDDGYPIHLYLLGEGADENKLRGITAESGLDDSVTFLGYQTNPYKYVSKCDLFVCSSRREGFSTAATEALIVGTPVCTVEVSGMKEMLGENNEYGLVTENTDEALYQGVKKLLDDPALLAHYREKAGERGRSFRTENTVKAVEEMLLRL